MVRETCLVVLFSCHRSVVQLLYCTVLLLLPVSLSTLCVYCPHLSTLGSGTAINNTTGPPIIIVCNREDKIDDNNVHAEGMEGSKREERTDGTVQTQFDHSGCVVRYLVS